jgi:hypothetical protein
MMIFSSGLNLRRVAVLISLNEFLKFICCPVLGFKKVSEIRLTKANSFSNIGDLLVCQQRSKPRNVDDVFNVVSVLPGV